MRRWIGASLVALDALCIAAGIWVAWLLWTWLSPNLLHLVQIRYWEIWVPNPWMPAGAVFLAAWLYALRQLGMHDPARMENSVHIATQVTRSAVYMGVFTIVVNFLVADRVYPKGLVLPVIGFTGLFLGVARLAVFRLLLRLEVPPTADNAVIVGVGPDALAMAERMERDARHVCTVAGFVRTDLSGAPAVPPERILGEVDDIAHLVTRTTCAWSSSRRGRSRGRPRSASPSRPTAWASACCRRRTPGAW